MKKIIILFILFLILNISYPANTQYKIKGVNDNNYRIISGIWVRIPNEEFDNVKKYSWGYTRMPKLDFKGNTFLEIDLNNEKSPFYLDHSADYYNEEREVIEVIEMQKNKYKLLLKTIDGAFNDKDVIVIEYMEDKKIWVHEAPNEYFQLGFFFKFGGPDIPFDDYYKPKMDNLKLYYGGFADKNFKELFLNKNEKIVILNPLASDQINGILGLWSIVELVKSNRIGFFLKKDLVPYKNNNQNINVIQYFTPTISNLRFRETPTLDGKFIRMLKLGEKLELIEKGKEETINGVKGTWLKVKTEKGEVGWCFDAYLELYDESKKK